jgi:sulfane dehydrogenase subunit SoxC
MRSKSSMRKRGSAGAAEASAANGLLDRRAFLGASGSLAAGLGTSGLASTSADAQALRVEPYMQTPGAPLTGYGQPSAHEGKVARIITPVPGMTQIGTSRTPHHLLDGMITPNGLHFERHHSGIPDISPDAHRFVIHGLVREPLVFTLDALARYPMHSRIAFIECAGNGAVMFQNAPVQQTVQQMQGLVSCAEWTGVRLADLLDEAGADPRAQWILAEGADASGFSRSIPLAKAMDDALVALYQNGERIRPSNGYPMRLLVPGFEGNMNVKWLRRIKLTEGPSMVKDETSKYTITLDSGKSLQFVHPQECKSIITRPSHSMALKEPGLHEISGLAWSGYGRIAKVDVSADGGKSYAPALLQEPVLPKALTRFRLPWRWDGGPAVLQSRATDDTGMVQPTRGEQVARRGNRTIYHWNAVVSWGISDKGEVKHVYA